MLRHAVLLVVLAGASASHADDGTTSLAEAVRAVNQQAAKAPESRIPKPLTEDQVIKAIEELARNDGLPEAQYREIERIVETRRLPKDVILRQFVRYNDGAEVQHGWWVRLMPLGDRAGTFGLTIRQESLFHRPYTQKERLFQDEFRQTGSMPLMNRLVAYFDEDPKFAAVQRFSQPEADRLADLVKKAVNNKRPDDLLKAYHWDGVDQKTRATVRAEAERFATRRLSSVRVSPRRFGGRLRHWQGFRTFAPNLPVLGYIVIEFADSDGPKSVRLEFGETDGSARLVNYIVSQNDGPRLVGKPVPGPLSVRSFPLVALGDGRFELYLQIEAPDELPALQSANLEIWRIRR